TRTLADNPHDLPFALIYLLDDDAKTARLIGTTGLSGGSPAAPPSVDLSGATGDEGGWPLRAVLLSGRAEVVTDLERRVGTRPRRAAAPPWPEPSTVARRRPEGKARPPPGGGFIGRGVPSPVCFYGEVKGVPRPAGGPPPHRR